MGSVEMPYTLVQDFTLFILMREKDIKIWKEKIGWIADNGGMVLVNVHPDYINFDNNQLLEEFPISYYEELLRHIKSGYEGRYWNDLPKNVAAFVKNSLTENQKFGLMEDVK